MKNSIKILLLENSNVQAKTILQLLRNGENNISVLIAENRKSYIELLNDNAIDIIICNHVLPEGFNSLEAMRIAKNIYPNIPCILLSGSINDDFAIELLKEGFDDYVSNDHLFFLPFSIENVFLKYSYKSEITKLESEIKILQESYNIIDDEKKSMTQSIIFAERIQSLTLPKIDLLLNNFKEAFIYYKPKDIVSGDFYWFSANGDNVVIVVADCTGHGVSGSLLAMLGSNFLNEIVENENNYDNPTDILIKLDANLCKVLKQSVENNYQDGIDLALISINKKEKKIRFCGCNGSLLYIMNGQKKINIYKGNSYLIGGIDYYSINKKFVTEEINYESGDVIYMHTDGYVDQFGGDNNKKFNKNVFYNLLCSFQHLSLQYQCQLIEQRLLKWKGCFPQTDDILVVGIKL